MKRLWAQMLAAKEEVVAAKLELAARNATW
jgi:hypothetical protein